MSRTARTARTARTIKIDPIFNHKVYEFYYDFCYVYERVSDYILDLWQDELSLTEVLSGENYSFVECVVGYLMRQKSQVAKKLIEKHNYFKLIDKVIWENLNEEVEEWCGGVDYPYEDMMSDCFADILIKRIRYFMNNDAILIKKVCGGCPNKVKCELGGLNR